MAVNPSRTPVLMYAQIADAGTGTIDFSATGLMGALYIINKGPSVVSMAFGSIPASAAFGNGKKRIAVNEVINLNDIQYTSLGFRSVGGAGTADIEAIGLQRSGSDSGGGAA